MKIPEGYQHVMPYLILKGAEDFLIFMTTVFEAKEKMKVKRDESGIMHAELVIGDSTIMFADSTDEFPHQNAGLYIHVENVDQTYQKAIGEGAATIFEPIDKEYGRSAGVKDKWGNTWWITSGQ